MPQIAALLNREDGVTANLGNVAAVLKYSFPKISWIGFYQLVNNVLLLGPFQGKPACTRIKLGQGVCGTVAKKMETILVPDVSKFPGHIYCDPDSQSEIVLPVIVHEQLWGVFDLDSYELGYFDETDRVSLNKILGLLTTYLQNRIV